MLKDNLISTIVVNYNAGDLLRSCVDSLRSLQIGVEIIVVDNDSKDGSLELLSDLKDVRVIRSGSNLGFASACNIGARIARCKYILFLNPDCVVSSNALQTMISAVDAEPKIGMIGGFLTNLDGTEQAGGRRAVPTPWRSFVRAFGLNRFADRWPRLFFDFHLHKQPLPAAPIEVEAISGACMLVKKAAVKDVGLWDEGYFLHCEDLDWCMRFRQRGWKIMFVPNAKVTHALGVCGKNRRVFVEWHKHKGMVRFYKKFFRHQYPGILMGIVTIGVWIRFMLVAVYYTLRRWRGTSALADA